MAHRPAGITALAGFFTFGAVMSGVTAVALLFPGGALEGIWRLNPQAQMALLRMGPWAIAMMAAVSLGCATSAAGLWIGARWGHCTALAVLTVNLLGDTANALFRGDLRTLIGLPIGAVMIAYLMSSRVRTYFQQSL